MSDTNTLTQHILDSVAVMTELQRLSFAGQEHYGLDATESKVLKTFKRYVRSKNDSAVRRLLLNAKRAKIHIQYPERFAYIAILSRSFEFAETFFSLTVNPRTLTASLICPCIRVLEYRASGQHNFFSPLPLFESSDCWQVERFFQTDPLAYTLLRDKIFNADGFRSQNSVFLA